MQILSQSEGRLREPSSDGPARPGFPSLRVAGSSCKTQYASASCNLHADQRKWTNLDRSGPVDVEVTSRRPVTTANGARRNPTSSACPIPPQSVGSGRVDRERAVHLAWALAALTNPARHRSRAPPLMALRCLLGSTVEDKRAGRARATPDPFIARATESHPGSLKHSSPGPETCQHDGRAGIDCATTTLFQSIVFRRSHRAWTKRSSVRDQRRRN
jgi:hypothetical protein